MTPKIIARMYFFTGECDPVSFASHVGLVPTKLWQKGGLRANTHLTHEENGMFVQSLLLESEDAESHFAHLFTRVSVAQVELGRAIAPAMAIQFSLKVRVVDETPALNFSERTLACIAAFKASLDIDLYLTD